MSEALIGRLNEALEGRYRAESQVGEGGMATVFLARDLRHNRNVALKVLKPDLAAVVGADRFLAEIETTANLQHPHILPLFDSGEAGGFLFYVMPYVEGESLREKLDREHQLPVDEALRIATNVAEALDYAHRHGVVHRDIKPANILLQDGKPVVSDFGIALALGAAGAGRLTETGLSLGTPHYMSPEQATGDQSVAGASDIYALGCVLYEMLVGEPPYTGSTPQAVLGKIIQAKPVSATEMRRTVPVHVDAVIRKALEKVPADRFAGAADFARALADTGFQHGGVGEAVAASGHTNHWKRVSAGLAAALAALAAWTLFGPARAEPPARVQRFALDYPAGGSLRPATVRPLAITPDGRSIIVNVAVGLGQSQLYLRPLGSLEMVPIRGTEDIGSFFVSPDGQWIGLNDPGPQAIVKVPIGGGPSATVAPTPGSSGGFRGADWGDAGYIVYAVGAFRGLMRVRDVGGVPDTLTRPEGEATHRDPKVLPGGEVVLFELEEGGQPPRIAALSVSSGAYDVLVEGEDADFVSGGYLIFRREAALWAARFDPGSRALVGDPVPVVEGIRQGRFYSISTDGTLVYATGEATLVDSRRLVTVRLDGTRQVLPLPPRPLQDVVWSPDGRTVAFESGAQVYTYDVVLNTTPRQITFEGNNFNPAFSPDGGRLAFSSDGAGTDGVDIFVKDLRDDSPPRQVVRLEANQLVLQWPADTLLLFERGSGGLADLWVVDPTNFESPEARPYLTSESNLRELALSPDGRHAAYQSNESGINEIYVRSFPTPGERTVISRGGGGIPNWAPDGRTLYYFTGPGSPVIAARLGTGPVMTVLRVDTLPMAGPSTAAPTVQALHPDGDRFIFTTSEGDADRESVGDGAPERLVVVTNFVEELRRLLGG